MIDIGGQSLIIFLANIIQQACFWSILEGISSQVYASFLSKKQGNIQQNTTRKMFSKTSRRSKYRIHTLEIAGFLPVLTDHRCQGLNSHYFHIIGDELINPIVGVYIPIKSIPIKGGMSPIPKKYATFDHGHIEKKSATKKHIQYTRPIGFLFTMT